MGAIKVLYIIIIIITCYSHLLNKQVKFREGKYVVWHTCPADDLEKKPIWISVLFSSHSAVVYWKSANLIDWSSHCFLFTERQQSCALLLKLKIISNFRLKNTHKL